MAKKIATQEDLDNNPELAAAGVKVGDEIEIPDQSTENEEVPGESDGDSDDTGGSNPPPNKERP